MVASIALLHPQLGVESREKMCTKYPEMSKKQNWANFIFLKTKICPKLHSQEIMFGGEVGGVPRATRQRNTNVSRPGTSHN